MFQTGLYAAAQRLPFLPMRAGLGSDVLVNNAWIKTVTSPYAVTPTRTVTSRSSPRSRRSSSTWPWCT